MQVALWNIPRFANGSAFMRGLLYPDLVARGSRSECEEPNAQLHNAFVPSHVTMVSPTSFSGHRPSGPQVSLDEDPDDVSLKSLCFLCKQVDWPNLSNWEAIKGISSVQASSRVKTLRIFTFPRRMLVVNKCRVCRLVGNLVNPKHVYHYSTKYFLEAYNEPQQVAFKDKSFRCVKLAVRSPATGTLTTDGHGRDSDYTQFLLAHTLIENKPPGIRILRADAIDFDHLKRRLKDCSTQHQRCRSTPEKVKRLRLIEVSTEEISDAKPNCKYVALSYVWGEKTCGESLAKFPRVVKDAMVVTRKLGCKYLWVDRCVSCLRDIHAGEKLELTRTS